MSRSSVRAAALLAVVLVSYSPVRATASEDPAPPPADQGEARDDQRAQGGSDDEGEGRDDPSASAESDEKDPRELEVFWKDGLRLETEDGRFRFRFGGRIQNDYAFWGDPGAVEARVGELESATEFRRSRLFLSGRLYDSVEFKAQYDFAGGEADFKDVFLGTRGLPADVRLGHFKEPFSLEEMTSSNHITFLERALPNVFSPSRNTGIMAHGATADGRVSVAGGVFREADDFGFGAGGDVNVTGRVTGAPVFDDSGRRAVHLGVSLSYKEVGDDGAVRFRQRPEVHLSPRFVDTGAFAADSVTLVALEAAAVHGPVSVQGEYVAAAAAAAADDPTFDGLYVQASYWITGESRVYQPDAGAFGRVRPRRGFLVEEGGPGGWEIAVRYSTLDLSDGTIDGGELSDVTVGANWHWNPNVRLMLNLVHARVERPDLAEEETATAFETRAQIDF